MFNSNYIKAEWP